MTGRETGVPWTGLPALPRARLGLNGSVGWAASSSKAANDRTTSGVSAGDANRNLYEDDTIETSTSYVVLRTYPA